MTQITDERFHIVEEAICDAFIKVIDEKELEKITVSDVIKKAGIVRSTFYNHYENIPDLITAMEDKSINDIFMIMETFHAKNNYDVCKSYYMTLCEYTMKNPFLSKLLISPAGDEFFSKATTMFGKYIKSLTQATSLDPISQTQYSYVIAGSIGTTIGILHKWMKGGCQESTDMIADILTRTFMNGTLQLIS